jgi:hypothetical protein
MPKNTKTNADRTVTRSFRISERALKSIEDEAKRQNLNLSAIINHQLLAYSDFERYFRRLGLIKISSATFERLLLAGSDSEVAKAGFEAGSDTPRSIILAKHGILNLSTVIDFLNMLSEFGNQFEFGQVEQGGKQIVTLLHNLGPKGSIFFVNYAKALFQSIDYTPKISSSDHSVVVEITPDKSQGSSSY